MNTSSEPIRKRIILSAAVGMALAVVVGFPATGRLLSASEPSKPEAAAAAAPQQTAKAAPLNFRFSKPA